MLLRFHIILVSAGILFCFGFSLYGLLQPRGGEVPGNLTLPIFFVAAGVALVIYLRRVLRYGLRAGPGDGSGDGER